MNKPQAGSIKIKAKRLSIRRTRSPNRMGSEAIRQEAFDQDRESSLPPNLRSRLWALFAQIEREFECVHAENLACKYTKNFCLVYISSFHKILRLAPVLSSKRYLALSPSSIRTIFRLQSSESRFILLRSVLPYIFDLGSIFYCSSNIKTRTVCK